MEKETTTEQRQWVGTTYGNGWMHKYLILILRHLDPRVLYLFVAIFVIPVSLCLNRSRKTAYYFYHEVLKYGAIKSAWLTYCNHCQFSQVVIDRFAMYAGRHMDVAVDGFDKFLDLSAKEPGFVHLSSHIGNYELAGYTLVSESKTFHALVFAGEKESVMQNRNNMFGKNNISMILSKPDMSHLFEIDKALSEGNIVSLPADRNNGSARSIECTFLGKTAKFPQGPFQVAAMRGIDVLAVNVMKESLMKYHIYITPLNYDKEAPRKVQLRQLADGYVAELEKRIRQYPTQWYNFFDFWA